MGLFDRFHKNNKTENQIPKAIWEIEDANDFLIAMFDYVSEKAQYGENINALSKQERIFLITQQVEMEVNNGGFSQYLYNSSGDMANEMVNAFVEIGAKKTAEICKKALAAYGGTVPSERMARIELLDKMDNDEINNILEECDNGFYEYEEDLNALNYAYLMKYKDVFR